DTSRADWAWRQDNALARTLAPAALREFQRAAQIRDAFFGTGGNMPSVNLAVIAPNVSQSGMVAKLDINGTVVESKSGTNSPVAVPWPGPNLPRTPPPPAGRPPAPPQAPQQPRPFGAPPQPPQVASAAAPSTLERTGAWSLFRLLDGGSPKRQGDWIVATFIVGGIELQYRFGG